jgi:phage shock protein E
MSSKRSNRNRASAQTSAARAVPPARNRDLDRLNRSSRSTGRASRNRLLLAVGGLAAALVAVVAVWAIATGGGGTGSASTGKVIQGNGGTWTNISAGQLATMLKAKDFTFLNVKTPYIGEIEGTDLYIPYTDLTARAAELPKDKTAKVVVYCRSGNESAIASQTLLDLGYTNILNLDGGMNAWTAAGHSLVQKART